MRHKFERVRNRNRRARNFVTYESSDRKNLKETYRETGKYRKNMDVDIEKIHDILIAANLPSSISDLKNPTEEYVVNLINTFLRRFHIDVNTIEKPTMEQQDIMSYCEDFDIIKLINLHTAMVHICNRIYVKYLYITDITSPGSKKLRKHLKYLANFILYVTNKESALKNALDEIQNRMQQLRDIKKKKNEVAEAIKDNALHMSKQLSLKDKTIAEIKKLQSKLEKNKKKNLELTHKVTAAEKEKQQAMERCGKYKAQTLKLSKTITELQLEIVESPEKYQSHLNKLENEQDAKIEERKIIQEAFQDKKHLIEQMTNVSTFVEEQLEKFAEVRVLYDYQKKFTAQDDGIKKKLDVLKTEVAVSEKMLETEKDYDRIAEHELNEMCAQGEDSLPYLRNLFAQLSSNKKLCKEKLEELQIQDEEQFLQVKEMRNAVKKEEEEMTVRLRTYQNLYDSEILTEKTLWKTWSNE